MKSHYGNCSGLDDCRCGEIDAEEEVSDTAAPEGGVILGYGGTFKVPEKTVHRYARFQGWVWIGGKWHKGSQVGDLAGLLYAAPADSEVVRLNRPSGNPGHSKLRWDHPEFYPVRCPKCLWEGMSNESSGGEPIADTGDYGDICCPRCVKEREEFSPLEDIPEPPRGQERGSGELLIDPIHSSCHAELTAAREEIARLTGCLKGANEGFMDFERKWYLRGDEIEKKDEEIDRHQETIQELCDDPKNIYNTCDFDVATMPADRLRDFPRMILDLADSALALADGKGAGE